MPAVHFCRNHNYPYVNQGHLSVFVRCLSLIIIVLLLSPDSFIWKWRGLVKYGTNEGVYFSLESKAYNSLYIAADTSGSYIVKGMVGIVL